MKAIVCEMCGSQDLVKQDGYYVCQNCRTKYAPEEAKKLMVEVSGSVKIDNSETIEKLYRLSRRAYKDANYEDAARYYQQISITEAEDWESNFFKVLCKQRQCRVADIPEAATTVANCLYTIKDLIDYSNMGADDKTSAYITVYNEGLSFAEDLLSAIHTTYDDYSYEQTQLLKKQISNSYKACYLLEIALHKVFLPNGKKELMQVYKNALTTSNNMRMMDCPELFSAKEEEIIRQDANSLRPKKDYLPKNNKRQVASQNTATKLMSVIGTILFILILLLIFRSL